MKNVATFGDNRKSIVFRMRKDLRTRFSLSRGRPWGILESVVKGGMEAGDRRGESLLSSPSVNGRCCSEDDEEFYGSEALCPGGCVRTGKKYSCLWMRLEK
ncbi:hypothetical protein AVEN_136936-1 [Araneus ventricosus]|uniref:Uncharacterized protein n=1 Tax=Araneus ventricosus TaxID=182803 RepID=A0A4Y2BGQ4_ARAVE|nr:hypothetical protein AVEN_136936-1 [Araneus ventricosus]